MARIKQGILGGLSGKIANVVGSSWKGIAVLKSLPLSVANPNTAAQQAQRGAMTQIVAAARILLAGLIQVYWNPFAQQMSGYNEFVKTNIATFTTAGFTTFANFYSTRGSLLGVVVGALDADDSDNTITVPWTDNSGTSDALATDEMVFVVYNEDQDYWIVDAGNATRDDATYDIPDTQMSAGDTVHVYTSASRPNISKVSDSVYATATVIA